MEFVIACIIIYFIYRCFKQGKKDSNSTKQEDSNIAEDIPVIIQPDDTVIQDSPGVMDNPSLPTTTDTEDYEIKIVINVFNPSGRTIPLSNDTTTTNSSDSRKNNKPTTPYYQKLGKARTTPNLFDKTGKKWRKNRKRTNRGKHSYEYTYNIYNQTNEDLFNDQCESIENHIPDLIKEPLQKDADGSMFQRYHHKNGDIVVCNSEFVGALYMTSDFNLDDYFEDI